MHTLKRLFMLFLGVVSMLSLQSTKAHGAPLETMIGQMVMVGFRGTGEPPLTEDITLLLEDISHGKIGGVIVFEPDYLTKATRNIVNERQLQRLIAMLQKRATIPLFIGVDQEGGKVRRLLPEHGAPDTPSAKKMGKARSEATYSHARDLGLFLARVGINIDFAPVVDVDVYGNSPAIGKVERAFSGNTGDVVNHARAFAKGLASAGVLYSYKHFPGHGSAKKDSHAGFTDITNTWEQKELEPYRQLIVTGMPGMVMVGHMYHGKLDGTYPASLSPSIISGLLRKELHWQGVVITDDMQMNAIQHNYGIHEAVYLAVNAGVDILLFGNNLQHDPAQGRKVFAIISELVKSGRISEKRIEESYNRIMTLKKQLQ